MNKITINEDGQILIPLATNKSLGLQNRDWLKVNIKEEHIVLTPSREIDVELIEALIHEGILIDP